MVVDRSEFYENVGPYCRYFGTISVLSFCCASLASAITHRALPEILSAYKTETTALSRVEKNALWKFTAAARRVPRRQRIAALTPPKQSIGILVANLERAEQRMSLRDAASIHEDSNDAAGSVVLAASCESPDDYVYCVIPKGFGNNADVLRLPVISVTKNRPSRGAVVARRLRKTKPVIIAEVTADIIMRNIKGPS